MLNLNSIKMEVTLDTLPSELIIKISKNLTKDEIYTLLEAIPKFETTFQDSEIGFFIYDGKLDGKIQSSLLNNRASLDEINLILIMLNEPPGAGIEPTVLKYPSLVNMLILRGFINQHDLKVLVPKLNNLKYLKIHLDTLNKIFFEHFDLNFPKLKELMIFSPNLGCPLVNRNLTNVSLVLANILFILGKANYPKLERLSLDIPFSKLNEKAIMNAIIFCLIRHKKTVKKFLLNFKDDWTIPMIAQINQQNPDLTEGIALNDISIRSSNKSSESLLSFFHILTKNQQLQNIYFDSKEYPTFPAELIRENASTLVSIQMDISITDIGNLINCRVFSECYFLKILTLISNPEIHIKNEENGIPPIPEFIHTQFLPVTLKSLRLCHLNINKFDVELLVGTLYNLKLIELQDIGETNDLGVTVESLNLLKTIYKVPRITIKHGFNRDNFSAIREDQLVWLRDLVQSALDSDPCVTFYLKDGNYQTGKGEGDSGIVTGEFIDLGLKDYKLEYSYAPLQLDHNLGTGDMEMEVDTTENNNNEEMMDENSNKESYSEDEDENIEDEEEGEYDEFDDDDDDDYDDYDYYGD